MVDRIDELRKSITQMTDEELSAYVRDLRMRRSNPEPTTKQRKLKVREREKVTKEVSSIFANLTPEMKAKLLKELEG